VAVRSAAFRGKADSVSPVPDRIALQGEERADSDAICPCPLQEKSDSGNLSGRLSTPSLGDQHRQLQLGWATRTLSPLGHTDDAVLAELSNHNKKLGRGQRFPPALAIFPGFIQADEVLNHPPSHFLQLLPTGANRIEAASCIAANLLPGL
jgi:hypothetical protein